MSTSSSLAAFGGAVFDVTYTECFDVLCSNSLVSSSRNWWKGTWPDQQEMRKVSTFAKKT